MPRRTCRNRRRSTRIRNQQPSAVAAASTAAVATSTKNVNPDKTSSISENTTPQTPAVPLQPTQRFQYTPKTKYQHSFFDEKGVYWPSTNKRRRKTPAEKLAAAAAKKQKKETTDRRLVEAHLRKAEVLFLFENGGESVSKGNKASIAKFLLSKYPGRYKNINSAKTFVKRTLDGIKKKWDQDPSKNPLRDGRTTATKPQRVSGNAEIRRAVEDSMERGRSCRELSRGMYHVSRT